MYYVLDEKSANIIERVIYDENSCVFNAAFMLDRHIDDPDFLNTELFNQLMSETQDAMIESHITVEDIAYNVAGVNIRGQYTTRKQRLTGPMLLLAEEITGGNPEQYTGADDIREIITYEEWIPHAYPELLGGKDYSTEQDYSKYEYVRTLTFQVTDDCNLACKYCYQINKSTRKMKFEDAKRIIDMIINQDKGMDDFISEYHTPAIVLEFIGGEPFLECELIEQIVTYWLEQAILTDSTWKHRFAISFSSNGTLYKQANVQRFLQRFDRKNKSRYYC